LQYQRNGSAVEVAVISGEEILLILRAEDPWKGCWGLPGGFVEFGEHPDDAAVRECLEETGYKPMLSTLCGCYMETVEDDHRQILIYKGYATKSLRTEISTPEEIEEVGWFKLSQLPTNVVPGFHQRMVFITKGFYMVR
jgi:8-oxo-dGTP diphosphatase